MRPFFRVGELQSDYWSGMNMPKHDKGTVPDAEPSFAFELFGKCNQEDYI